MAKTYTVSNQIPQRKEDWALTQWTLTLADTQKVERDSEVAVEADLGVTIRSPSASGQGPVIWSSEQPATLSGSGQLNGSGYYDDGTGPELLTIIFSMVQLTEGDPDGPIVERHITMLTLEGDPEDVGVMGGSEGEG